MGRSKWNNPEHKKTTIGNVTIPVIHVSFDIKTNPRPNPARIAALVEGVIQYLQNPRPATTKNDTAPTSGIIVEP
jgi:hypothetical protein